MRTASTRVAGIVLGIAMMLVGGCASSGPHAVAPPSAWNPPAWIQEGTVELGVVRADGAPHWFKVWLAVVDGQAYVRLGAQSAAKLEENRTKPLIGVRVAGHEFQRVRAEPSPAMADRVAGVMAEKYWSDIFIRLVPHPVTARLTPES